MTFTALIPTITQSLSTSRPLIVGNFSNYKTNMEVNHGGVNGSTAGKHIKIQMPTVQAASPGTAANEIAFYTKSASGQSQLFMQTPGLAAAGLDVQMTKALSASIAQIGVFDPYGGAPVAPVTLRNGGYTFLPGALILQYGLYKNSDFLTSTSGQKTVTFPIPFPLACFAVYVTWSANGIPTANSTLSVGAFTTGQFVAGFNTSSSSDVNGIYWWALGT